MRVYVVFSDDDFSSSAYPDAVFSSEFKAAAWANSVGGDVIGCEVDVVEAENEIRTPYECLYMDGRGVTREKVLSPMYVPKLEASGYVRRYNKGFRAVSYESAAAARELCERAAAERRVAPLLVAKGDGCL